MKIQYYSAIVCNRKQYDEVNDILSSQMCQTTDQQRMRFAGFAFEETNDYDSDISNYFFRFQPAFEKLDSFRLDTTFNLQRYEPEEAFYGWHCERAGLLNSNRLLVWMVYLNTVKDGGETQFYFQNHMDCV